MNPTPDTLPAPGGHNADTGTVRLIIYSVVAIALLCLAGGIYLHARASGTDGGAALLLLGVPNAVAGGLLGMLARTRTTADSPPMTTPSTVPTLVEVTNGPGEAVPVTTEPTIPITTDEPQTPAEIAIHQP